MTGYDESRGTVKSSRRRREEGTKISSSSGRRRESKSPTHTRDGKSRSRRHHDKSPTKGDRRHHHHNHERSPQSDRPHKSSASSKRSEFDKLAFHSNDFILKRTTDLQQDYQLGSLLGEGGFGACYTAQHRATGVERACKILPKSTTDPVANLEAHAEFQMMAVLDHPNIAKVYELYEDETSFYIITDLYKGGELFDIVEQGQLNEYDTAQVVGTYEGMPCIICLACFVLSLCLHRAISMHAYFYRSPASSRPSVICINAISVTEI